MPRLMKSDTKFSSISVNTSFHDFEDRSIYYILVIDSEHVSMMWLTIYLFSVSLSNGKYKHQ